MPRCSRQPRPRRASGTKRAGGRRNRRQPAEPRTILVPGVDEPASSPGTSARPSRVGHSTSTASSTTPAARAARDVARPRRRRPVGALGDRAARRIDEVLAEVLGREVRERAEANADAGSRARRPRRRATASIRAITSCISARSCIGLLRAASVVRGPRRRAALDGRGDATAEPGARPRSPHPRRRRRRRAGQPAERAGQLDRVADAERVRRGAEEPAPGAGPPTDVEAVHASPGRRTRTRTRRRRTPSRRRPRRRSDAIGSCSHSTIVDAVGTRPVSRRATARPDRRRRRGKRCRRPTTRRLAHRRSTSRSRKWVAHEMHGS